MATFPECQQQDGGNVLNFMNEDVRAMEDALENLNTPKSASRMILSGILSKYYENYELKPKFKP